jgi:hypothetical protein
MATNPDPLAVFRAMLDPANWPVKPDEYIIHEGEIYAFVSDDPLEERIWKPLYRDIN